MSYPHCNSIYLPLGPNFLGNGFTFEMPNDVTFNHPGNDGGGKLKRKRRLAGHPDAQIEVVPCKICSDKSSGVHYGVITCEGCKGFFRRSQLTAKSYHCQFDQNCIVDKVNRNKCQYCRWKKCIESGMSREAVKFGRMSKNQREKVEDEVNMHKELNKNVGQDGISERAVMNDMVPSINGIGSDQYDANNLTQYSEIIVNCTAPPAVASSAQNGYTTYTALSPVSSSGYSSSHASTPTPTSIAAPNFNTGSAYVFVQNPSGDNNEDDSGSAHHDEGLNSVTRAILDAFQNTSIYTAQQIEQLKQVPLEYETLWKFRNMSRTDWWSRGAAELTLLLRQVVEFAKSVPGFMNLPQDDQIVLLKTGAMDVAIVRIAQLYDLKVNAVAFNGVFLPLSLIRSNDTMEQKFVYDLFSCVRELASFALSETEMALYCALVLMTPNRVQSQGRVEIGESYQRIAFCLEIELQLNRTDVAGQIFQRLLALIGMLQNLSAQHSFMLNEFLKIAPDVDFPPLYKELFIMRNL